jgi:hypothetical protein
MDVVPSLTASDNYLLLLGDITCSGPRRMANDFPDTDLDLCGVRPLICAARWGRNQTLSLERGAASFETP